MSDPDAAAARQALAEKAEQLRQQRTEKEASERAAAAAVTQALADDRRTSSPSRMRKSLSHLGFLAVGLALWMLLAMGYLSPPDEPTAQGTLIRQLLGGALFLGGAAIVFLHFTAVGRAERWRAALPFALDGIELLGLGEAVTSAQLIIAFKDTKATEALLTELAKAHLPPESTVAMHDGQLTLVASDLDRGGANHALAKWLRAAVNKVLLDVHRGYPIDRVTLRALKTDEFYVPAGD